MARLVVAVSGGVDSVVLLDKLVRRSEHELIVAHFDHGIRSDSAEDAVFVHQLAQSYHLSFETRREELGADASEELARERRYAFLREMAAKYDAPIVTAHHADDAVETIAINISRGTGWRGLAVLDSNVIRPLLKLTKQELLAYAAVRHLEWREDSTNASDAYLRNRLRRKLATMSDDHKLQLLALRDTQVALKRHIDEESEQLLGDDNRVSRYFFTMIDEKSADELLRGVCIRAVGVSPTRPQRRRALLAIKTARAGAIHQMGDHAEIVVDQATFSIRLIA